MVSYQPLAPHRGFQGFLLKFAIGIFILGLCATSGFAQLPDFRVDTNSITFSNPTPVEGEEITIWVEVKNSGEKHHTET